MMYHYFYCCLKVKFGVATSLVKVAHAYDTCMHIACTDLHIYNNIIYMYNIDCVYLDLAR